MNDYSDEFLFKLLKDKLLLNALLTLKHGRNKSYVIKHFNRLVVGISENLESEIVRNLFHIIFFYIKGVSKLPESKLVALVDNVSKKDKKMVDRLLRELETKSPIELLGREADLIRVRYRAELAERLAQETEKRAKEAEKRARKEAKLRREEERRRREEEKRRREEEKRRGEEESLRKETEQTLMGIIINLSNEYKHSPEVIATITNKSIEFIQEVLKNAKN